MQTILDTAHTWFLDKCIHTDKLTMVILVEGFLGPVGDIKIGNETVSGSAPLEPEENSRKVVLSFERPVAWQAVDESYTIANDAEVSDDKGYLQILSASPYLDYVDQQHGWYKDVVGPAKHYRIWTEFDVIDIIAHQAPGIEVLDSE